MNTEKNPPAAPYDNTAQGSTMTGTVPVRFELTAVAVGKRRNEVQTGMVEPLRLRTWDLASDEAPFHGGDETAPKPLSIFATGILTCFMTQVRNFARACGVEIRALKANAGMDWTLQRNGTKPYVALPGHMQIDIHLDTDATLEAQQHLISTAAQACFAEATLREPPLHRLWYGESWVECDVTPR
ncbi:OsmC family protein [Hydrogenophaga crassostreae]|nr:OsmC family protein [Hydrogenophaga crassostreae]